MRKNVYGRQFKRDVNERKALFKSLLSELVLHERIQTTEEKAKAIKADADKLITKAKRHEGRQAHSLLQPLLTAVAVNKVMHDLAPRFAKRPGGYTRIIRLERRFNDNAKMALIEWTEKGSNQQEQKVKGKNKNDTTKKQEVTGEMQASQPVLAEAAKKTTPKRAASKKTVTKKATTPKEETK